MFGKTRPLHTDSSSFTGSGFGLYLMKLFLNLSTLLRHDRLIEIILHGGEPGTSSDAILTMNPNLSSWRKT